MTNEKLDIALSRFDEKLDVAFSKLKRELILWIVGAVGLGVLVNHFWR